MRRRRWERRIRTILVSVSPFSNVAMVDMVKLVDGGDGGGAVDSKREGQVKVRAHKWWQRHGGG